MTMFWPEVEFEYDPGGGKLTGNRISMAFTKTSVRPEVERKMAAYPVAKEVRVFYDPDNITDAYLKNPKAVVAKTKMAFAGIKKEDELADLIAYLKSKI